MAIERKFWIRVCASGDGEHIVYSPVPGHGPLLYRTKKQAQTARIFDDEKPVRVTLIAHALSEQA